MSNQPKQRMRPAAGRIRHRGQQLLLLHEQPATPLGDVVPGTKGERRDSFILQRLRGLAGGRVPRLWSCFHTLLDGGHAEKFMFAADFLTSRLPVVNA